jgi:hypothetical protein
MNENNYVATVVRLPAPEPHPNADRLAIYKINGVPVILTNTYKGGELGLFFPDDGQVSEDYAAHNDLIQRKDENGNRKGGMMDHNRRVRAINLRGQKSYGLWLPIESLDYLLQGAPYPAEGTDLNSINGVSFCNKYYTKKTLEAMANRTANKAKPKKNIMFLEHIDTGKFAREYDKIKPNMLITVTEKVHGTSGRFGYVKVKSDYPWYHPLKWFGIQKEEWQHLVGSRRVILGQRKDYQPFYGSDEFRYSSVKDLYGKLRKGETIYFELVGWIGENTPIMPSVNPGILADKSLVQRYGEQMYYTYGTKQGEHKMIVYRITMTNEDGESFDLTWPQVVERSNQLGVEVVKVVDYFENVPLSGFAEPITIVSSDGSVYNVVKKNDLDHLLDRVNQMTEGESLYDTRHIREGVVVRADYGEPTPLFLKSKSHIFLVMEGHTKDREDYLDMEESA